MIVALTSLLSVGAASTPALASGCTTAKPTAPSGYEYVCVPPVYVSVTTPGYWTTQTTYKTETVMVQKTESQFVPGYWTTEPETLKVWIPGYDTTQFDTKQVYVHSYWYTVEETLSVFVPGHFSTSSEYIPGHEG